MSFLRRNQTSPDDEMVSAATPEPATPSAVDANPPKKAANAQWLQYLQDSYNGLYKVVLEPSMPTRSFMLLLIVGIVFGMVWAYVVSPADFSGGNPNRLNRDAQDQWLKMIAVGLDPNSIYSADEARKLLAAVENPAANIQRLIDANDPDRAALEVLLSSAGGVIGTPAPRNPGLLNQILQLMVPILIAVIVTPVFVLMWRILIRPNVVDSAVDRARQITDKEYGQQKAQERQEREVVRQAAAASRSLQIEPDALLGEPVMKHVSLYTHGRAYDDSFEIELGTDGGSFLGQCGSLIPDSVSPRSCAVEVWLFDMGTQQNVQKVFMTQSAYNDLALRGRVQSELKSDRPDDIIPVSGDRASLVLDSATLRLRAELADVAYDATGNFTRFQLQLATWQKAAQPTAPTAPPAFQRPTIIPPLSQQTAPATPEQPSTSPVLPLGPPEDMTTSSAQPSSPSPTFRASEPSITPLGGRLPDSGPPPFDFDVEDDDEEDDDPFGGTGEFTPLG